MDVQQFEQYQQTELSPLTYDLSPQSIEQNTRLRHMTFDIRAMAWDKHNNTAVFYRLMWSASFPLKSAYTMWKSHLPYAFYRNNKQCANYCFNLMYCRYQIYRQNIETKFRMYLFIKIRISNRTVSYFCNLEHRSAHGPRLCSHKYLCK